MTIVLYCTCIYHLTIPVFTQLYSNFLFTSSSHYSISAPPDLPLSRDTSLWATNTAKQPPTLKLKRLKFFEENCIEFLGEDLGKGSYGCVKKVRVNKDYVCAAKCFRTMSVTSDESLYKKFAQEDKILSCLDHPNIVRYIGIAYTSHNLALEAKYPVLIMELLWKNLHDYLLDPERSEPLHNSYALCTLHDISKGLEYLHAHNVIHRDLTAKNVLLDTQCTCVAKIADFGNSRLMEVNYTSQSETMTGHPGTRVYTAPEASEHQAKYSKLIDIFSFGHLTIFVAIEEFPQHLLATVYVDSTGKPQLRDEIMRRDEYIRKVEARFGRDHELISLIKQCLNISPKERPNARYLREKLNKLCKNNPIPAISRKSPLNDSSKPAGNDPHSVDDPELNSEEIRNLIL